MSSTAQIIILDEIKIQLTGVHRRDLDDLVEKYAIFAPNYMHTPKYKLGLWDGRKRFFWQNGTTYLNLLPGLIKWLKRREYAVKLKDNRKTLPDGLPNPSKIDNTMFHHIVHPTHGKLTLMDHQVEAVNALVEHCGGIVTAATSAGKTFICAALCNAHGIHGHTTVTIVPSVSLVTQTYADYKACGLDVGRLDGEVKDVNHQHLVTTWQSLKNVPHLMKNFTVAVVDECHGARAQQLQMLIEEHGSHIPYRYGVTGTMPPEEADEMMVRMLLGPVRYSITAAELIARGVLAKPEIIQILLDDHGPFTRKHPDLPKYTVTWDLEKNALDSNVTRIEWIAQYARDWSANNVKNNTFILVNNVTQGKRLAKLIPGAKFLYGKDKDKVRQEAYQLFANNDNLTVVATIGIAGVGLSINRINHLVSVDVGKSFIRVMQMIGRGLRKAHDKDSVFISDIGSKLPTSQGHASTRRRYYKDATYPCKKITVSYDEST